MGKSRAKAIIRMINEIEDVNKELKFRVTELRIKRRKMQNNRNR